MKKATISTIVVLLIATVLFGLSGCQTLPEKSEVPSGSQPSEQHSTIVQNAVPSDSSEENSTTLGEHLTSLGGDATSSFSSSENATLPQTSTQSQTGTAPTRSSQVSSSQKKPTTTTKQTAAPTLSKVQALLTSMTLEEKVAQMFVVTPEQLLSSNKVTAFSGKKLPYPVGGVVLFAANIVNPTQCKSLIQNLQSASNLPLFVSVDEEGGRVARIAKNSSMGTTVFPPMNQITTKAQAFQVGKTIGKEIKQFGFNLDFAPVADVNSNPNNPVIGDRSFGSNASFVAEQVASAVEGFRSSGVLCSLKHFPGHGDTATDSHLGSVQVNKTLGQLKATEFVPFAAGIKAGADFVMVGHIALPLVTGNQTPATLSPEIIGLLRNQLNFQGLIITDSMAMGAITEEYSSGQAARLAVLAGVDLILMPKDLEEAMEGILQGVKSGAISETRINQSVARILQTKIDAGILR